VTAGVRLGRAVAHGWAVLLGYPWRQCASVNCGRWFGGQEQPITEHLETIPGGEDDPRLLCPGCIDAGVGCRAHAVAEIPYHHDGCEHVPEEIWPDDDTDTVPGRSGPYLMVMTPDRRPSPWPRLSKEPAQPMEIRLLPEPAVVEKLASRAAQRRIRAVGERARILAAHKDMLAGIPDADSNAPLRTLLVEHVPVFVEAEDRLVCRGCAPSEPLTEDKEYPVRLADGPCPTWSTIHAHYEKESA
jgi:hypothetical protein